MRNPSGARVIRFDPVASLESANPPWRWLVGSGAVAPMRHRLWRPFRGEDRVGVYAPSQIPRGVLSRLLAASSRRPPGGREEESWVSGGHLVREWTCANPLPGGTPDRACRWLRGGAAISRAGGVATEVAALLVRPLFSLRAAVTGRPAAVRFARVTLVARRVAGGPLADAIRRRSAADRTELSRRLARLFAGLHEAGIVPGDSITQSLVVTGDGRIGITDLDAIRLQEGPVSVAVRVRSLGRLNVDLSIPAAAGARSRRAFLVAYLQASSWQPRSRLAFWRAVEACSSQLPR